MAEEDEEYEGGEAEAEEGGGKKRARQLPVKKGVGGASVTLAKPLQGPAKALRDAYDFQTVPDASIGALCARFVATGMMPAGAAGGSAVRAWFAKEEGERLTRQGKSAPPPLREAVKECRLCHKHRLVSHALAANTRPWDCSLNPDAAFQRCTAAEEMSRADMNSLMASLRALRLAAMECRPVDALLLASDDATTRLRARLVQTRTARIAATIEAGAGPVILADNGAEAIGQPATAVKEKGKGKGKGKACTFSWTQEKEELVFAFADMLGGAEVKGADVVKLMAAAGKSLKGLTSGNAGRIDTLLKRRRQAIECVSTRMRAGIHQYPDSLRTGPFCDLTRGRWMPQQARRLWSCARRPTCAAAR